MRVFTHTEFDGHWPVGTAAVVVALSPEMAKWALERELKERGLEQEIKIHDFVELNLDLATVHILMDGNY